MKDVTFEKKLSRIRQFAFNKKINSRDLQICMFTFNFLGRWYEFFSTLEIATESVLESVRFVNRDVISTTIS